MITAEEFWDNHPDKESYYWKTSGINTYNTLLNYEKKNGVKKKKALKVSGYDQFTLKELNKLSLDIANKYLKSHPNSWEERLSEDVELKKIKESIKKKKNGK